MSPASLPTPTLEKRSYRDDIYSYLRTQIVEGILEPEQKLRDADLAVQLGVSRTPVREALRRLEDEGLVQTKQNAWTRVAPVTRALAERIYPILRVLEGLALELAAPHLDKTDLSAMRDLNAQVRAALNTGDARAAALLDSQLHERFITACPNPELQGIIRTLKINQIRLEIHYWRGGSTHPLQSVAEHETMIAALEQGDLSAAQTALEGNYTRALERWAVQPETVQPETMQPTATQPEDAQ